MSFSTAPDPVCKSAAGCVELIIEPRARDLGGFTVRRVLPSRDRQMVGPFIFFDHMGPAKFPPGEGISVRPHPHIGLATVTYLFEGEILHRDSLGFVQPIRPGAVNLMTAGSGIVHSERAGDDLHTASRLHGIQSWMALPDAEQETDPAFEHFAANALPALEREGVGIRIIIGEAFGVRSPVDVHPPMLYLECRMQGHSSMNLHDSYAERAVYLVNGRVKIGDEVLGTSKMAILKPGETVPIDALEASHVMIVGGANLGKRHIWWNFVSTSKERIERARADWREGRFAQIPGDSTECIPLPD